VWIRAGLLAVAAVGAYSTSFAGVLVLDDVRAIVQNPTIRTLWPLSTPLAPPGASTVAGRPIANLSFAINYALTSDDWRVWGYHGVNLVIHLAAGLTLFGIVRRTLASDRLRERFERSGTWLAFVVALLWLVHPLQTSAVTYVVQRVESLMGLFYLLTLSCAIRASAARRPRRWAAAAIASCALGMATKEVMVTAPVVVALWYWTFADAPARRASWPVLAGLAGTWVIFGAIVSQEHRGPSIAFDGGVAWRYLLTQAEVVTHYARLAVWPAPLVFLYTWPLVMSLGEVIREAAFVMVLLALTIAGIARRHPLGFVGAWFFVILAPTSSIIPIVTEVAAEHRMYLPLASVIACAVIGARGAGGWLLERAGPEPRTRARAAALLSAVAVGVVVLGLGVQTRERNRDYASAERLWQDTVDKQPANSRARTAYGELLAQAGRMAEAEAQYQAAVASEPADAVALARLGSVQAAQGKLAEAIASLERALALRPDDVDAHRAIGLAYSVRQEDTRALPHLERALAANPDDAFLLAQVAGLLADSRDPTVRNGGRAVDLAERAVTLTGRREPVALEILSAAYTTAGQLPQAKAAATEALALARAHGNQALVSRLQYRLSAYESLERLRPPR
jgi:tetratricopeptide (TPR) repeat protein